MLKYVQVNSFSRRAFGGGGAAVFVLPLEIDDEQMQTLASELAQPVSVFLKEAGDRSTWDLRCFTPRSEVTRCGHGTLAAAHVLYNEGHVGHGEKITFRNAEPISATKRADHLALAWPLVEFTERENLDHGLEDLNHCCFIGECPRFVFVEVESPDLVASFQPGAIPQRLGKGLVVTAVSSDPTADFVFRSFFPLDGVAEDPVTGSAAAVLGQYYAGKGMNREILTGRSLSTRGGYVHIETANPEFLTISGQCSSVGKGIITAQP